MAGDYDLVVVGGGAAGLVAARESVRRGARTALVQAGPPGGDCTFTGCVPSKALLAAAADGAGFDRAMARVRRAVSRVAATEDAATLAGEGIDVVSGSGRFRSPGLLDVEGRVLRASRFVVATGARPVVGDLAAALPLTNETVFQLPRRPASLVVVGAGPAGCELAQAFARLGTRVTLVDALDRVLPREEPEASAIVARALAADGIELALGSPVAGADRRSGAVRVRLADGRQLEAEELLVAAGREPAARHLGLEEVGVRLDPGGAIQVDDTMATSAPGVWAAGDVTAGPRYTHAAARMAWVAAANALSRRARLRPFRFDASRVPAATFTSPEVGRVGLTESAAARAHRGARVAHLPLSKVDRAIAVGVEDGFVKLVAAPRTGLGHRGGGRLVGATAVAPTAGELIHEAAVALQTGMFVGRLAQTIHAYPTWSMAIQQAALQFFGRSGGLEAREART